MIKKIFNISLLFDVTITIFYKFVEKFNKYLYQPIYFPTQKFIRIMAMRNPIISRKEFDQAITSTSRQRLGTIYSVGMLYVYRTCIAQMLLP